ncbi:MAG: hypothetical protein WCC94_02310 [Candidatus Bathyarchaeia archaeon]
MNEIVERLHRTLLTTNLPEILNGSRLLKELRYLILAAVAPCSPHGVAKTKFNRRELQEIAQALRLDFEYYHEAPQVLEETLAQSNLVVADKDDSGWTHFSITSEGIEQVVRRVEDLQMLAEVVALRQKYVMPVKPIRIEARDLPKTMVRLAHPGALSVQDLDTIQEQLIRKLVLNQ